MKLTKQQQNGLLLMLYVSRAGRCKTSDAAETLGLSCHFLEQIARKLRIAGLLKSQRGPGGGYSVVGEPTVGEVLRALGTVREESGLSVRSSEHRALAQLQSSFFSAIAPVLRRKVRSLNMELAAVELAAMEGRAESTVN